MGFLVAPGVILGNAIGLLIGAAYCLFVLNPLFGVSLPALVNAYVVATGSAHPIVALLFVPPIALLNTAIGVLQALSPPAVLAPVWLIFILALHLLATALLYWLAQFSMTSAVGTLTIGAIPDTPGELFARGALIGLCAGANLPLLVWFNGTAALATFP
jgi:hypothetical protein